MFTNFKASRNIKKLLSICSNLIEIYERNNKRISPSCKTVLCSSVKIQLDAAKKEIAGWRDDEINYSKIAHTLLANHAFDLMASGQYHLYRGELNPMSCAPNLMVVYKSCMQWALDNGFITAEDQVEQFNYLMECISEVG